MQTVASKTATASSAVTSVEPQPISQADNRPATVQARGLLAAIERSPRQVAQRAEAAHFQAKRPNQTGLPDTLKAGVEKLSGHSLDDVQVHYNSDKPAQLQAHAYAQGSEIHIAPGQEKHLPHEAWHVAQQKQGRVKETRQLKGVAVNDDSRLEKEAEMGGRAASKALTDSTQQVSSSTSAATSAVVQGYFMFNGKKSTDKTLSQDHEAESEEAASQAVEDTEHYEYVWTNYILPAIAEFPTITPALMTEFNIRDRLLNLAKDEGTKRSLTVILKNYAAITETRSRAASPLNERPSPDQFAGKITGAPSLSEKEKHSTAAYTRVTGDARTPETFDSDSYTKGPARRERAGGNITTPRDAEDAAARWTSTQVRNAIQTWSCTVPLARHLALTIWPLLQDNAAGRKWEIKFREMDRLIATRDAEAQSSEITIYEKAKKNQPEREVKSFSRKNYNQAARKLLQQALLANTKHPASQQEVTFYDELLRGDAPDLVKADSTTFELKREYEAKNLSMTLTHWRPILLFDWILAEDVLNHATA